MIRRFLQAALLLSASTAQAWEFTPGLPCLLTFAEDAVAVELTHDPTKPLFSISITRPSPWPVERVFAIRFEGPQPLTISTDRQELSEDGRRLTVTDRGFGNVLNGMQFNTSLIAILGETQVEVPLAQAGGPVAAFRVCKGIPSA